MTNQTKAYSYLRFSTPEQLNGDSLRRQTDAATIYAEKHGLDLQEQTFRDLGVSAYHGKNALEGALGQFMEAVESGKIKPGSFLLVENLDRLSRDRITKALNQFQNLLEKGITVVTLTDGKRYTAESLNELTDLMLFLLVAARAHEESKTKSERLSAAWKNKRERAANGGHIITGKAPAWLRVNNGKFVVIKDRAAIVQRIFALAIQGHGKGAIARMLNTGKVPVFGKSNGWYHSYIEKILVNEAVIGRFQPHRRGDDRKSRIPEGDKIPNYFPVILSESDFYKVKRGKVGLSGKGAALPRNVLSGIVFCKLCGGKMHYVNRGNGKGKKITLPTGEVHNFPGADKTYLVCDNAHRKRTCKARSVRYQPVLHHVLDNLANYRSMYELSLPSEQDRNRDIDAIQAQIDGVEETISRLLDTLERVTSASTEKRLADHETRLVVLQDQKTEAEEKRAIRETAGVSDDDYVAWYNRTVTPDQATEITLGAIAHLGSEIRRNVEKIILEKDQPIQVIARSEN